MIKFITQKPDEKEVFCKLEILDGDLALFMNGFNVLSISGNDGKIVVHDLGDDEITSLKQLGIEIEHEDFDGYKHQINRLKID